MAVQIAALISLYANQFPLSILDSNALVVVGSIGIIPITLNLYTLLTFNPERTSWYLCGLSLCTEALSIAVVFTSSRFSFSSYNFQHQGPEACDHAALASFCQNFGSYADVFGFYGSVGHFSDRVYLIYPVLLAITLGLTLCQPKVGGLRLFKAARNALKKIGSTPRRHLSSLSGKTWVWTMFAKIATAIKHYSPSFLSNALFWKYLMHICMFAILFVSLLAQYTQFAQLYKGSIQSTWGFGQIVGITIWVPVIAEYLYLQISKSALLARPYVLPFLRKRTKNSKKAG